MVKIVVARTDRSEMLEQQQRFRIAPLRIQRFGEALDAGHMERGGGAVCENAGNCVLRHKREAFVGVVPNLALPA